MSDVVIKIEGLGKQYRIGKRVLYKTFRESIADAAAAPFRRLARRSTASSRRETFWALKDVSFDVNSGEVVGIIGRNGAGKSTLLRLLSRITEPTEGQAEIIGRVGSLLEVGTGFHHELTGRENIYLNGAILGMKRGEIARKFDEIIAFAEVEKFLDTPVKHYSSGMYMRLAFAVAAHLEPEILVVDEVLAVGDAQFQKKCFAKMQSVSQGGKTILFVSHNLSALRQICSRAVALSRGKVVDIGEVNSVADHYLANELQAGTINEIVETDGFRVDDVVIESAEGPVIKTNNDIHVRVTMTPKVDIGDLNVYFGFLTMDYQRVAGLDLKDFTTVGALRAGQQIRVGFDIHEFPLLPGRYQLELHLKDLGTHRIEPAPRGFPFDVVESPVYGGRKLDMWYGLTALKAQAFVQGER